MTSAANILFVDNNKLFLDTRAEFLEDAGYRVLPAISLEEARRVMEADPVDLVILDVRMVDDDDKTDVSGILLAKEERYAPIPKIILTDFPDYATAREALGPVLDGMPPAVDYLAKAEGPEALVERVGKALARFAPWNSHLVIRGVQGLSTSVLVSLLEPQIVDNLAHRTQELERLFKRLFLEAQQVTLGPVYVQGQGYIYLAYTANRRHGDLEQGVLACALREVGEEEEARYKAHAPRNADLQLVLLDAIQRSVHYTLCTYNLVGAHEESVRPLAQVLHALSTAQSEYVLDVFFGQTLDRWHRRERTPREMLSVIPHFVREDHYSHELEACAHTLGRLLDQASLARLEFDNAMSIWLPNGTQEQLFLPWLAWERGALQVEGEVLYGHVHGQVDLDHILVDREGNTWLIDFTQARQDFLVMDYLSLEMSLRHCLLQAYPLSERLVFEKTLMEATFALEGDPSRLDLVLQEIRSGEWEIDPLRYRAIQWALEVRRQAYARLGVDTINYLKLLYGHVLKDLCTFHAEIHYTVSELQDFAQDLVLLGLLGEAILTSGQESPDLPEEARTGLWIDHQNRQVWVLSQLVTLTPQEYTLLTYLHRHRGRLCTPEDITYALESEDYEYDKLQDEARLRSAVNRLRRKIEPDPKQPRFLLTVRGHGYKLAL